MPRAGPGGPARSEGAPGAGGTDRRPARVCYVTESFYPPDVGGLQRHAFELARRLRADGVDLFVVTRRVEPAAALRDRAGGVPIRRLPPPGQWKGRGWRALPPLSAFLARVLGLLVLEARRYDVVLVGGLKLLPLPAVLACAARGRRCVIRVETPTELSEDLTPESLRRMGPAAAGVRTFRALRDALVRRADAVVAPSAEIRGALLKIGVDPARIRPIPYGIEVRRFHPVGPAEKARLRDELGLPRDRVLVTFTGRLAVSKGLPLLIRAWDELVRSRPGIHLAIVGSAAGTFDPCEAELRGYVRERGIEETVTFTGEVENVHEHLQASDLFAFPSAYESFGLAIVEALACGLPAVVTRVGVAADEVVDGESGLLVEPGDGAALRDALGWLLDHPGSWKAMGERARRGIAERYSLEVVTRLHREVLEDLAALAVRGRGRLGRGAVPDAFSAPPESR